MKRLLTIFIAITLALISVNAADFYTSFEVSGTHGLPDDVFVSGAECANTQCSDTTQNTIDVYSGDARTCFNQRDSMTVGEFTSCMDSYEVTNDIVSMQNSNYIITKVETPSSFGYLTYFSASNDSYLPFYVEQGNFDCEYQVCVNDAEFPVSFEKKDGAIAEIGQVVIRNTQNDLAPVQVEVPVEIAQTVCSAYTRTLNNAWEPNIPSTYSDFNAGTVVNLEITSNANGSVLHDDQVFLPIEADTCAGFAAFDWTPSQNLENETVTFEITTDVVDNQVINAQQDRAEVVETIYPEDLDNTCWVRMEDFTLTNRLANTQTSSLAQITQGEFLYATLDVGAFRDNAIAPMDYRLELSIDGTTYFEDNFTTTSQQLNDHVINLSQNTSTFPSGNYDVVAQATPINSNCDLVRPVTHTQELEILEPELYDVDFVVVDENSDGVENAQVEFTLLDSTYDFVVDPTYSQTEDTLVSGFAGFNDVLPGEYRYEVTHPGYEPAVNTVTVGSDMTIIVNLQENNQPPVVNLPEELNVSINVGETLNLTDYIYDVNEDFSSLTITSTALSGAGSAQIVGDQLLLNSSVVGDMVVEVNATDSDGMTTNDTITVHFIDGVAPVVNSFTANPNNGEAPFTTNFQINVSDANGDALTCTIDFGDNTTITQNCSMLNGVGHTYTQAGTYTPTLEVNDGTFTTTATTSVVVFTRNIPGPADKLEIEDVVLNIDKTIAPGEFEFNIQIFNETLMKREVFLKPTIVCGDVTTGLASGYDLLSSRAISKETREDGFAYVFELDTQDFKNNLPKDSTCRFNVQISDEQGTDIKVSKFVEFSYPSEEAAVQSIRGEMTDILSYMDIVLQNSQTGYNSESFRLINNDGESKEISITLASRELNLHKGVSVNLAPNTQKDVSLSYFLGEVESGYYPVRVSINDGDEHQTRYSYIRVE